MNVSTWLLYPFTVGLVASVNACGFPLLPVYLSLFIEGHDGTQTAPFLKIQRALSAGLFATLGFVVLFGVLGLITETGLSGTYDLTSSWARYPLALLGVLLVLYGIATIAGRNINLHLPQVRPGLAVRRPVAITLFGISYGIASLGCSLPLFLGAVSSTFTHRGVGRGIEAFLAYAIGMGLFLTVVALLMSLTGVATTRRLRILSPLVRPLGGVVLIVVGIYVAIYWISEIINPANSTAALRFVDALQSHTALFFQSEAKLLGVIFGSIIGIGLVVLALRDIYSNRHASRISEGASQG